jgi:hypothetical protein
MCARTNNLFHEDALVSFHNRPLEEEGHPSTLELQWSAGEGVELVLIRVGDPIPEVALERLDGSRLWTSDVRGRWAVLTFLRYAA